MHITLPPEPAAYWIPAGRNFVFHERRKLIYSRGGILLCITHSLLSLRGCSLTEVRARGPFRQPANDREALVLFSLKQHFIHSDAQGTTGPESTDLELSPCSSTGYL